MKDQAEAERTIRGVELRLGTLLQRLTEAHRISRAKLHDEAAADWRAGVIGLQINALMEFLESFDDLRRVIGPFQDLTKTWIELVTGRSSPLVEHLQKQRDPNRPKASLNSDIVRVHSAIALHLAVAAKLDKKTSAAKIARILFNNGHRKSNGEAITARAVCEWRERLMTGSRSASDLIGRCRIENVENDAKAAGMWPPTPDRAEAFIAQLSSVLPPA